MAEGSVVQLQQVHSPGMCALDSAAGYWQESTSAAKWYAVFTLANHEKRVSERCARQQIESFLPLYKVKRKWKNRCTVDLELPLFPNYFFVRIVPRNRIPVLQLTGVISIVSSTRQLLPIADEYITALREALLVHKIEPQANIGPGEWVRIRTGPLTGAEGVLERHKNGFRVLLKLEMLTRSISVEVGTDEIESCGTERPWDYIKDDSVFSSANRMGTYRTAVGQSE